MGKHYVAELLASRAASIEYERLPAEIVAKSRLAILDCLGVALAGSRERAARLLVGALDLDAGPRRATVIGGRAKSALLDAALVNGALSHVLDFDDTYLPAIYHGTSPALAAALAAAERAEAPGSRLIAAHVAGYEIGAAVAAALYPEHVERGWHVTATAGTLGACAAAGQALGAEPAAMAVAYGLAGTQAAGLRAMLGTMAKCLHAGKAAANGLLAALLASSGFDGDVAALDRDHGFFDALGGDPDRLSRLSGKDDYFLAENTIKAYPCAILIHPAIRAALVLRERYRLAPEAIEDVTVTVCPEVSVLVGKTTPATGLAAKFSTSYAVAVALLSGAPQVADFTDDAVGSPRVSAVEERVRLESRAEIAKDQARVRARLRDGSLLEEEWRGGLSATEAESRDKFLALASPVLSRPRASELLELVLSLDPRSRLSRVTRLLRTGTRPAQGS